MKAFLTKYKIFSSVAVSVFVLIFAISGCKFSSGSKLSAFSTSFKVALDQKDGVISIKSADAKYQLTEFKGMTQDTEISGTLGDLKAGEFLAMPPASSQKFMFSFSMVANETLSCSTPSMASPSGVVSVSCTGEDNPLDVDHSEEIKKYQEMCINLGGKDIDGTGCECGPQIYGYADSLEQFKSECEYGVSLGSTDPIEEYEEYKKVCLELGGKDLGGSGCECGPQIYGYTGGVEQFKSECQYGVSLVTDPDPDPVDQFAEYKKICTEVGGKLFGDQACECGPNIYGFTGSTTEFRSFCEYGTGLVNTVDEAAIIQEIKNTCSSLSPDFSYNISDDYCECYGVGPLPYADYLEEADPVAAITKACKGE